MIDGDERIARRFTPSATSNAFVSRTNDRRISQNGREHTRGIHFRRDIVAMQLYLYRAVPHHTGRCSIYNATKHTFVNHSTLIIRYNSPEILIWTSEMAHNLSSMVTNSLIKQQLLTISFQFQWSIVRAMGQRKEGKRREGCLVHEMKLNRRSREYRVDSKGRT